MNRSYQDSSPRLGNGVYIDPTALLIGDVTLGNDVSIWPMTVIRGDVHYIEVGDESNVQDGCVLHVTHSGEYSPNGHPLVIGRGVTVGHRAVLHGCAVGESCLIGIGAIVMDGAVLESRIILGAGSLVPPGRRLEACHLYLGSPARKVRPLQESELLFLDYSARNYVALKNRYLANVPATWE